MPTLAEPPLTLDPTLQPVEEPAAASASVAALEPGPRPPVASPPSQPSLPAPGASLLHPPASGAEPVAATGTGTGDATSEGSPLSLTEAFATGKLPAEPFYPTYDLEREFADEAAREKLAWQQEGRRIIHESILNPANFFAGKDLSFAPTPEDARMILTVDAFLEVERPDAPLGMGLSRDMLRDEIALAEGWDDAVGDDATFYEYLKRDALRQEDTKSLAKDMARSATASAIASRMVEYRLREISGKELIPMEKLISMAPSTGEDPNYTAALNDARTKPGYSKDHEWRYLEQWHQTIEATDKIFTEFPLLAAAFAAIQDGDTGTYDYRVLNAANHYMTLDAKGRDRFMASISLLAQSLPEQERSNFFSQFFREATNGLNSVVDNAAHGTESLIARGLWQITGDPGVPFTESAYHRETTAWKNFLDDLQRIQSTEYDPLEKLWGDGFWGDVEAGIYGAPAAIGSVGVAAIPYAGWFVMGGLLHESAREDMRARLIQQGVAPELAGSASDQMAPTIAAIQFLPERIGTGVLLRRFPALEKVFDGITDRIANRALRGLIVGGISGAAELGTETFQDFAPNVVQDLFAEAHAQIPGADWEKYREEFWSRTTTTAVSLFPLAGFAAAGGLSSEARAAAFKYTDPRARAAFGITPEDNAAIDAATGPASLRHAVDIALANRDPESEHARAAVESLQQDLEADATAALSGTGESSSSQALPRFSKTGDTWTVFDGRTGAEVGQATTPDAALRLANAWAAHTAATANDTNSQQPPFLDTDAASLADDNPNQAGQDTPFSLGKDPEPDDTTRHEDQDHQGRRDAGTHPEGTGSRTGRNPEEIRSEISRAIRTRSFRSLKEGSEFTVFAIGEEAVLKFPKKEGTLTYDRQGRNARSSDPEAVRQKVAVLTALGGMETSVFDRDGETTIFQERGTEITNEDYANAFIPRLKTTPEPGGIYRLEMDGRVFMISDLHPGNFVKDKHGNVRLIDLVVGEVDPDFDFSTFETVQSSTTSEDSSDRRTPPDDTIHERFSKTRKRDGEDGDDHEKSMAEAIHARIDRKAAEPKLQAKTGKGVLRDRQLHARDLTLTPEERLILESPFEILLVYTADGRLKEVRLGTREDSTLPSNLPEGAILSHNHPGGRGPSASDIKAVLTRPGITLRVVTENESGKVEIFSLRATTKLTDAEIKAIARNYSEACRSMGDTAPARRDALTLLSETTEGILVVDRRVLP